MINLSTRSDLHAWISFFVDWVAPEPDQEDAIREQAEEVRGRIRGQAEADGLTVRSTPNSGSFAKRTGLRRHQRGKTVVEGQDVDLPFVVSPLTDDDEKLDSLLDRFDRYAAASYPTTKRDRTKSSVVLDFKGTGLLYDLVPMLAVPGNETQQVLIRRDGERRRTSVQQHIEFIRSRTTRSQEHPGRVKFNECVRLLKWWRCVREGASSSGLEVPSFLIDLLAAAAFDRCGVEPTYAATLATWFSYVAHLVRARAAVTFEDFGKPTAQPRGTLWTVLDPVVTGNNIVSSWVGYQIDELAEWFEEGRDSWVRILRMDAQGQESACLTELEGIFGSAFRAHCGDDR
jgi:hypothetical protein